MIKNIKNTIQQNIIINEAYQKYIELKDKFNPETDEHILFYSKGFDDLTKEDEEIINKDSKELKELEDIFETKLINLLK